MTERRYILRLSGEIYTKARQTRLRFQKRLAGNVADALSSHGVRFRLEETWSRFYLDSPDPEAPEVLARVFGLQSVSAIERRSFGSLEELVWQGEEFFGPHVAGRRFAVRATRRGDRGAIPFDSQAVENVLGRALLARAARVDLGDPEVTAHVEVEPGEAHFFLDKVRGPGGLPLGAEGRAVALVSGGFDSAVAAWLLLKRGVHLDYVFCNLGGAAHRLGVLKVMKVLSDRWSYGSRPRLHEIDLRPLVEDLQERTSPRHWQVLLKRLMLQAAEGVARQTGGMGIVTGDAIGQVASQTLPNLAVISQATSLPVLRPVVGFNKEEILAIARRIGVYELAAAVAEYCGLAARRPATRADRQAVADDEAALDPAGVRAAVAARTATDLRGLDVASLAAPRVDLEAVPAGATVLDLRSAAAFRSWHYPGALHLELPRAVAAYPSFERGRTYVLYCEVGLKSAHLAERMQEAGFDAYHVKGGLKTLIRLAGREDALAAAALAPAVRES